MNKGKTNGQTLRALACIGAAAAAWAAACLIFGAYYDTNDDPAIANIAAGAFGEQSEMLVYVNVLLGLLFKALYKIAFLPWFYIVSTQLVILSLGIVGFVITDRIRGAGGVLIYAAVLLSSGFTLFANVQYTKNAAVILSAGLLLIVWSRGENKLAAWLGAGLFAVGSLVRFNIFVPVLGVFLPALVLMLCRTRNKSARIRAAACLVVSLALVMGCHMFDTAYYENDPDWSGFIEYNSARTDFLDYKINFADRYGDVYDYFDLGVSRTEYDLAKTWNFNDPDFFTTEKFRELSAATASPTLVQRMRDFFANIPNTVFSTSHYIALILCSIAAFIMLRGREKLYAAATLLFSFGGMALLGYMGRFIDRAAEAIVIATYCAIIALLPTVKEPDTVEKARGLSATIYKNSAKIICCAAVAAIVACSPYEAKLKAENRDYENYGTGAVQVIEAAAKNKQTLYILDSEYINAIHGRDAMHTLEPGALDNVVFFGSWLAQSGFEKQTLARFGETNAFAAAAHNPNARMYVNIYMEEIVNYIFLHYGTGPELIPNSDGSYSYAHE